MLLLVGAAHALMMPATPVRSPAKLKAVATAMESATVSRPFLDRFDDYKENSRAMRRTVYGPAEWRKHRSTKRYFRAMFTAPQSGVLRGLALELLLLLGVASAVVGLSVAGIATLTVPALPLTLTAPALGMLITFRTNQAYSRWWEARIIWGGVINKTRDLMRQANWFRDMDRAKRLSALSVAFTFALNAHCLKGTSLNTKALIGEHDTVDEKLRAELTPLIGAEDTKTVLAGPHRPVEVCHLLTKCLSEELTLTPQIRARVDENIAFFSDFGGMCDRISKTPMPLVYTRHTARFLFSWLLFVPAALLGAGLGAPQVLLGSMAVAILMMGIDELGIQIEEPFSVLPMDSYCNGLKALHDYQAGGDKYVPAPM